MASKIVWTGIDQYTRKLESMAKARHRFEKEYLKIMGDLTLKLIKQAAPRDTGDYANSWSIVKREKKAIEIDTSMPELFLWLENGTRPHEIRATNAKALALPFGFAKRVMHTGTQPQPHIIHVVEKLDDIMRDVMFAQIKKHNKLFNHVRSRGGVPNTSNITKTVGLTGTHVSSLRGRGKISMIRMRTGRKQFKRRLGRRRRTGKWIKRAGID